MGDLLAVTFMIAYLKGKIKIKTDKFFILENQNIGYRIFCPQNILEKLKLEVDQEFFIHHYLAEDRSDLYGFLDLESLQFFELLLSISGVGPKSGLGIMDQADVKTLKQAILSGDSSVFTKVSGVGKKTAERVLIELSNKIEGVFGEQSALTDNLEAIEALTGLGYKEYEVKEALKSAPADLIVAADRVKWVLKYLGR